MFRAGHAHAGVLVIFSLIAQLLIDYSGAGKGLELSAAAILVSGGFLHWQPVSKL